MFDYQEAARIVRNCYQKEWRQKNPEKVKAAAERYWVKRAVAQRIHIADTPKGERNHG